MRNKSKMWIIYLQGTVTSFFLLVVIGTQGTNPQGTYVISISFSLVYLSYCARWNTSLAWPDRFLGPGHYCLQYKRPRQD